MLAALAQALAVAQCAVIVDFVTAGWRHPGWGRHRPPTRPCPRELGRVGRKKGGNREKLRRGSSAADGAAGDLTGTGSSLWPRSLRTPFLWLRPAGEQRAPLAAQFCLVTLFCPLSHPHKKIRSQHQLFCRFSLSSHSHTACFIFISAAACGGHPAPGSRAQARILVNFETVSVT